MAVKRLEVEGLGTVTLQKRRNTRSIRLLIQGPQVKVTLPYWVPYSQALKYLESKMDWVLKHKTNESFITDGTIIGKSHRLKLIPADVATPKTRVTKDEVLVYLPRQTTSSEPLVQAKIVSASERALHKQSQELVAPRVSDIAMETGLDFSSLKFKKLRSRWGSCDHKNNLVLNIFLVQLPWELIDYVILHELAHTVHHNHSPKFWDVVASSNPDYKSQRKNLKAYHTHVLAME